MAGLFSALKHEVKSAALEATGLENISDLIKQNPNDIHMLLSFLIVLAYPTSGGDQTSPDAKKRDKYMSQLKNQNNAQMVINSIFRHLNTILSLTVDTPLSGYAASILDSVSFSPIKQEKNNAKAAVNAQQNGNGILKGGAGAPVDKNNGKRIAILRGLGIVFKLIDKKKLDYIATYSADTSAILKSTISNVKELLSSSQMSSVRDKAEEDTKLIENILNTVNYDLGFVQSKIINETDIRSFTNISEFVEFLDTQKKAAQQLLEVMQKAGPLRKIFDNMTDDDTDNDTKTKLIKHYESSFDSIVTWLSSYIENQAPYIAQLVEGSKSAQAATTSKGSGETAAGQTATTPGMAPGMPPGMMPGMPMGGMPAGMPMGGMMPAGMPAGMPMGGMMPGMPAGMPMGGMPMGGMPMGGMMPGMGGMMPGMGGMPAGMPMGGMMPGMGGMPMGGMMPGMGGMPMGGMPMGGMPMGGMPMGGMPMGGMPMGGMPMGGMPMGYAGGSKKTLKHKKGKGKNNKHFTIKNKKVHNKNA